MNINMYMQIHVNIFKIYTVCVFIYISIHSTHTHMHTLYIKKLILDAINRCPALVASYMNDSSRLYVQIKSEEDDFVEGTV